MPLGLPQLLAQPRTTSLVGSCSLAEASSCLPRSKNVTRMSRGRARLRPLLRHHHDAVGAAVEDRE
jgi:hypothetical protein